MNGIIIYDGKYGATRQYALWLSKELHLPVTTPNDINSYQLAGYNFMVLGSAVYMGKLLLTKWLEKHSEQLQETTVYLYIVCGTPPEKKTKIQQIIDASIPAELGKSVPLYFLPGRMIRKDLSLMDSLILRAGAFFARDKEVSKQMLQDFDGVKKEQLQPLLLATKEAIQQYQASQLNELFF